MTHRFIAVLIAGCSLMVPAKSGAQENSARQSIGISTTFSPNSSHILIGNAEGRRTWTGGVEYSRRIWRGTSNRLDLSASASLFSESDPTVSAITGTANGQTVTEVLPMPTRVILTNGAPFGPTLTPEGVIVAYPVYGPRETTYAMEASPIGARWTGFTRLRLQPTFGAGVGLVYASQPIPVDSATSFNYEFSLGPGIQFVATSNLILRLDYSYRHISNANQGQSNPGIDSGVFRLTISRPLR